MKGKRLDAMLIASRVSPAIGREISMLSTMFCASALGTFVVARRSLLFAASRPPALSISASSKMSAGALPGNHECRAGFSPRRRFSDIESWEDHVADSRNPAREQFVRRAAAP
jgi:hypothetical protein